MRVRFLGTGTSNGVPVIGCDCEVCRSTNLKDKRLRSSVLIEAEYTRLLIDCGPDFRQQALSIPFEKFDGVLLTHIHYDHVGGIDDLRPYCKLGDIDLFANEATCQGLRNNLPYCFTEQLYPGVPRLNLHTISPRKYFRVGNLDILPFEVMHGNLPILAYRIGQLTYITDMKTINTIDKDCVAGTEVLIINALRWEREHHSHHLVDEAIAFSQEVGAKRVYLTHLTDRIGLHDEAQKRLPTSVFLAYDGLVLDMDE